MLIFVTAFVLQFVGHHIGDFLLQTNKQAINKGKDFSELVTHASIYGSAIALMMMIFFVPHVAAVVYLLTIAEHIFVDSRKPVIAYKNFYDRVIWRDKDFQADELPLFVVIGIDQAFHYVRIFLIALIISKGWI